LSVEAAAPLADQPPYLPRRERRAAALAQHFVEGRPQVRRAVDERAVEIEDQQKPPHRLMTVRCDARARNRSRVLGGDALDKGPRRRDKLCVVVLYSATNLVW